jgi:hypothetical protein
MRVTAYAKMVAGDVIGVGRAGTLVDWEQDAGAKTEPSQEAKRKHTDKNHGKAASSESAK